MTVKLPLSNPPRPTEISRDLALLHPVFRTAVEEVLHQMALDGMPFAVFEAYRTPNRQAYLYGQGRTRSGKKITNAQAWQSYHQYGLAVDFALYVNGKWSWDAPPHISRCWDHLHEVGEFYGLHPLSSEQPHLQLAGVELADLQHAIFPSGGNAEWWENLEQNMKGWTGSPSAPRRAEIVVTPQPITD